jgi:ParB family chromosome partitioning protein
MSEATAVAAPEAAPAFDPATYAVQLIPINKIQPSRHQARQEFDEEGLKALSEAIQMEGLLNPINVRPPVGDTYELVAGERRLRACKLLGYQMIPVLITPVVSEGAASIKTGMENLQRQELNPIEEAEAFNKPLKADPDHWTQEKVAQAFGKRKDYVSRSLSLLGLTDGVKEKLRQRNFSREHGVEIARLNDLNDKSKQEELADRVVKKSLTKEQTRKLVDDALGKGAKKEGEGKGEGKTDPLADLWTELGIKAHYKGGSKWVAEIDLGKAEDFKQAVADWGNKIAQTAKPCTEIVDKSTVGG